MGCWKQLRIRCFCQISTYIKSTNACFRECCKTLKGTLLCSHLWWSPRCSSNVKANVQERDIHVLPFTRLYMTVLHYLRSRSFSSCTTVLSWVIIYLFCFILLFCGQCCMVFFRSVAEFRNAYVPAAFNELKVNTKYKLLRRCCCSWMFSVLFDIS